MSDRPTLPPNCQWMTPETSHIFSDSTLYWYTGRWHTNKGEGYYADCPKCQNQTILRLEQEMYDAQAKLEDALRDFRHESR